MIKRTLIVLFVSGVMLEMLLRFFDPWGVFYLSDLQQIEYQNDGFIWRPMPGEYQLTNTKVTILPDYSRSIPDTNLDGDCLIVAIGDSTTYGQGVSDNETWLNSLAQQMPSVHFINTGVNGYDTQHILTRYREYPQADGFIYFITLNDYSERGRHYDYNGDDFYLQAYFKVWVNRTFTLPYIADEDSFISDVSQMENTLLVTRDEVIWNVIKDRDNALWVDWHVETISMMDAHANPSSNARLAELLYPAVSEFVNERCSRG
jgi:hypothetical protein